MDVYFFPCRNTSSPAAQVTEMVNYIATNYKTASTQNETVQRELQSILKESTNPAAFTSDSKFSDWRKDNVKMENGYGIVWIDVENDTNHLDTCNWLIYDGTSNCDYLKEII